MGADYQQIIMEREDLLPKPPQGIFGEERALFIKHFKDIRRGLMNYYKNKFPF